MSTDLRDIIRAAQLALQKVNDKIDDYHDANWIADRVRKLADKREVLEQDLMALMGAQKQLTSLEIVPRTDPETGEVQQ